MNSYDQKSRNKCLQFSQFFWSNFVDNSVWSEFLAYRCSTAAPCHPSVRPSILEISYQMVYFNITTNILPSLWSILVRSTHTHTRDKTTTFGHDGARFHESRQMRRRQRCEMSKHTHTIFSSCAYAVVIDHVHYILLF